MKMEIKKINGKEEDLWKMRRLMESSLECGKQKKWNWGRWGKFPRLRVQYNTISNSFSVISSAKGNEKIIIKVGDLISLLHV